MHLRDVCARECALLQEPDQDDNSTILIFEDMVDLLTNEKVPFKIIYRVPLRHALKAQVLPSSFAIFHLAQALDEKTLVAQSIFKPDPTVSKEMAVENFKAEVASAKGVVEKRRTLKRERSHLDPETEEAVKRLCFTPERAILKRTFE